MLALVCRSCAGEGDFCEGDGELSDEAREALLSEDVVQCLHRAITCWEELVQKMKGPQLKVFSLQSCVSDPLLCSLVPPQDKVLVSLPTSCRLLQLAVLLSNSLHLPHLALRAIRSLLSLSRSSQHPEVTAISHWTQTQQTLLLAEVWGVTDATSCALCDAASEGVRCRGTQVLVLNCKLAQASVHLLRGEVRMLLDSSLHSVHT